MDVSVKTFSERAIELLDRFTYKDKDEQKFWIVSAQYFVMRYNNDGRYF